jgi:hypothetical protein
LLLNLKVLQARFNERFGKQEPLCASGKLQAVR